MDKVEVTITDERETREFDPLTMPFYWRFTYEGMFFSGGAETRAQALVHARTQLETLRRPQEAEPTEWTVLL